MQREAHVRATAQGKGDAPRVRSLIALVYKPLESRNLTLVAATITFPQDVVWDTVLLAEGNHRCDCPPRQNFALNDPGL